MKKLVSIIFVIGIIMSMVVPANAQTIETHYSNAYGNTDAYSFLNYVMEGKGMPKVANSYFSNEYATKQQVNKLLSWYLNTVVDVNEEPTKENLISLLAKNTGLKKYQIESVLLKTPVFGRMTVKELNYYILCMVEHPLTAKDNGFKIQLYGSFNISATNKDEVLLDIEMLQLFVPSYIYVYGDYSLLTNLSNELVSMDKYVRQNCKMATKVGYEVLSIEVAYTGAWMHQVAIREDTQIFDEKYEKSIENFWKHYMDKNTIKGDIVYDAGRINKFIIKELDYFESDNRYTVAGAIIDGGGYCGSYADTFKFLANMVGIECILVANSVEVHQWVQFKTEKEWVNADPTWDDHGISGTSIYFAKNDDEYVFFSHPVMDKCF